MKSLQVQAFGKLRLQYEGQVVASFPTRHVEELLGFFLLNRDIRHSREKLIGILWPSGNFDKSRSRFSTVLWRLRALFNELGPSADACFRATRDWVSFSPQCSLHFDAELFQNSLNQINKINSEDTEQVLQEALSLYKGVLLEGVYSDWCLAERERMARLRLRAMGQLMACCIRRRGFEEAVGWGQTILQEDPLREEVHRAIMQCQRQMGRYPQAVQQFQTCAELLRDELGILPLPDTIAVYQEIVAERLTAVSRHASPALHEAFTTYHEAANHLNQLLDDQIDKPQ